MSSSANPPQPTSRPNSPPGIILPKRIPRVTASTFTRLSCLLLNRLQMDIQPTQAIANNFFAKKVPTVVYGATYYPSFADVVNLNLSTLPSLACIEIAVATWKQHHEIADAYHIGSLARAVTEEGTTIALGNGEFDKMDAQMWTIFPVDRRQGRVIDDADTASWEQILRVLRRESKICFDQSGEIRTDPERARVNAELELSATTRPPWK